MKQRLLMLAAAAALLMFALAQRAGAAEAEKPPGGAPAAEKEAGEEKIVLTGPLVVKLEEVPALGKQKVGGATRVLFPRGPMLTSSPLPAKEIKKLPTLQAKRPMYGCLTIGGSATEPAAGAKYHFVFDQSEEAKPEAPAEKTERAVVSRIKPDRLYFDADGDCDLTNDPVIAVAKTSPFEGMPGVGGNYQVFEEFTLEVDAGKGLGKQPLRLVPMVTGPAVYFAPAIMRRGTLQLGGQEYVVQLTQGQPLSPRFDVPTTLVEVTPTAGARTPPALASGTLGMLRVVGGELCTLTATPRGDQLTIAPYKGDTGTLEVGPGGRAITHLGVAGQLTAEAMTVPMGDTSLRTAERLPRGHKLPVGDYAPSSLLVDHGRLRFAARTISDAYLEAAGLTRKPPKYNIPIRKDKAFLLEFSGKPEVIFLGPKKDQEFKVGSTVLVRVMLAEPENGLMITGLWTSKEGEEKPKEGEEKPAAARQVTLDPTISIKNAKGEEVAQGKLPFG